MTFRLTALLCLFIVVGCDTPDAPEATSGAPYVLETVPLPDGLTAETGGLAVLPDGRLAACFRRGELMLYDPDTQAWSVFATGLHDPLGLVAEDDGALLVVQRPELTRLRDTDNDGRADVYETVSDAFGMSGNYHEFAFGPARGPDGRLYYSLNTASNLAGIFDEVRGERNPLSFTHSRMYATVPYRGWVMRVEDDGTTTPFAAGFRSPSGIGFDTEGRLFVTDNQGDWLGTSKLYHVERGHFYGHPAALVWEEGFDIDPLELPPGVLDAMRTPAAVLFPHAILANSPTQMAPIPADFGPFEGQLLVGEMDWPRLIRVMLEEVDGALQGAAVIHVDSLDGMRRGTTRLVFGPDGSLWTGQSDHGWLGDRGIQRITWTGATPMAVHAMRLTDTGFDLTFTLPVDETAAARPETYRMKRYYYEYHRPYGSDQMDVADVPVTDVAVSDDGRTVSLTLAELRPGYVHELHIDGLASDDGTPLEYGDVYYTLNRLR